MTMRNYSSIKHLRRSLEDGAPINLALSSQKRPTLWSTHQRKHKFAIYPYASLWTNTHLGNAKPCGSRLDIKQMRIGGDSAAYHTTRAQSNMSAAVDALVEKEPLQEPAAEDIPELTYTSEVGLLPAHSDYDGLGRILVIEPKATLYMRFVEKKLIILTPHFTQLSDFSFTCEVECFIPLTAETIVTNPQGGVSKKKAEKQALLALISSLHVGGQLRKLFAVKKKGQRMKLPLDSDMLIVMRESMQQLIKSSEFLLGQSKETGQVLDIKGPTDASLAPVVALGKKVKSGRQVPIRNNNLPVSKKRKAVLNLVRENTYSLVVADAGSGKSTQVPQLLLDEAIMNGSGSECKILCVQPRRMAAFSLAHRVAEERGGTLGQDVGYTIRFDSHLPTGGGTITYCTTGVFLNALNQRASYLDSFSHIILDEAHERNVDLDLSMLLLKRSINKRQAIEAYVPKVIVMSATLDVDLFSSYLQNKSSDGNLSPAPHIYIPGRTFPITKHYLDEIIDSLSKIYSPQALSMILHEPETRGFLERYNFLTRTASSRPAFLTDESTKSSSPIKPGEEDPLVPFGLICAVICHILATTKDGSILVFLPGMRHIAAVERALLEFGKVLGQDFSAQSGNQILQVHSSLPTSQKELFQGVPRNCRRIILSTDIAETSVTIPDVKHVVDTGKVNMNLYDPLTRTSRFACCWTSQSSINQRAGRAGRVQAGEYYALFTEEMQSSFRATKHPEIMRGELLTTCIKVKRTGCDASILQESIDPPSETKVDQTINELQMMNAVNDERKLTPLGNVLSSLSMGPYQAKLVLLGVLFRCLDPLLAIASMASPGYLYHAPPTLEERSEAKKILQGFSGDTWSDHISAVNAFIEIRKIFMQKGRGAARRFAVENNMNFNRFTESFNAATQAVSQLVSNGLISQPKRRPFDYRFGASELNINSERIPLIKALLLYTLYPNIAAASSAGSKRYCTNNTGRAQLSNRSVNYATSPRCLLVFDTQFGQPGTPDLQLLYNTTHVTPLAACLLGGRLQGGGDSLALDSWLKIVVQSSDKMGADNAIKVLIEFRKALEAAISAGFNALVSTPKSADKSFNRKLAASRENAFSTVAKTLIDVLDRDIDPVYRKRHDV